MLLTLVHGFNNITLASASVSTMSAPACRDPSLFNLGRVEGRGRRRCQLYLSFIKKIQNFLKVPKPTSPYALVTKTESLERQSRKMSSCLPWNLNGGKGEGGRDWMLGSLD